MKRLAWICSASLAMALIVPGLASAHEEGEAALTYSSMWARATITAEESAAMGGMAMGEATAEAGMAMGEATAEAGGMGGMGDMMSSDVSAAYGTITNTTDHDLRLVGATTDAAGAAELHEVVMSGDVMQMQPLTDGLLIPAGESVSLEPGGFHIMLLDLTGPLAPGAAITLTLQFADADGATIEDVIGVPVVDMMAMPGPSDFAVSGAWVRPTALADAAAMDMSAEATASPDMMSGEDVSAAYVVLYNQGAADDTLVSAATDAAGVVEIHEVVMQGDVMQMQPVEGGLVVPAGGSVSLEPGGYHIMLLELTGPIVEGSAISITLTFASGAQTIVGFPAIDRMMMAGMSGM